jgi:hypothetical protein
MYIYTLSEDILLPSIEAKGKAIPLQAWTGPEGSRRLRLPEIFDITRKL